MTQYFHGLREGTGSRRQPFVTSAIIKNLSSFNDWHIWLWDGCPKWKEFWNSRLLPFLVNFLDQSRLAASDCGASGETLVFLVWLPEQFVVQGHQSPVLWLVTAVDCQLWPAVRLTFNECPVLLLGSFQIVQYCEQFCQGLEDPHKWAMFGEEVQYCDERLRFCWHRTDAGCLEQSERVSHCERLLGFLFACIQIGFSTAT